jgi:cytochrome c-type biogenesis protein CcmH
MKRLLAGLFLIMAFILPAQAVQPDEILADPVLEARARALSENLRCLVCQNQSIDDSNAPLARDLRILIRERLKAGDSDAQAIDFVVARYGEFVLLRPRFTPETWLLWIGPFALLLIAGTFLYVRRRRGGNEAERPLEPAEETALKRALASRHRERSNG